MKQLAIVSVCCSSLFFSSVCMAQQDTVIQTSTTLVQLGVFDENTSVAFDLKMKANESGLKISGVAPSCNCIAKGKDNFPVVLAPGETKVFQFHWQLSSGGLAENDIHFFGPGGQLISTVTVRCTVRPAMSITPTRLTLQMPKAKSDLAGALKIKSGNLKIGMISYGLEPPWERYLVVMGPEQLVPHEEATVQLLWTKDYSETNLPTYGILEIQSANYATHKIPWRIPK